MPSGPPSFPSSTSSNPVLDKILSIGPLSSSPSPITRFDLSPSFPESHRSVMVTAHPSATPAPTSAPDLGATAEDDGIPKPGLCKGKEVLNPPSANSAIHANTMVTLDLPLQSPSLQLVPGPDVAIAGQSLRTERTGDQSPRPSHRRYEII
ncbi:hypothetical protein EDB84DRAFT_29521 [Lactarius hengduanensis]|nr:hypothetical protein EDB84DRAFT_29521 [Lactarius hengduanensis]